MFNTESPKNMGTGTLVMEHGTLNDAIDAGELDADSVSAGKLRRLHVKLEVAMRALAGDDAAMKYAASRRWPVAQNGADAGAG